MTEEPRLQYIDALRGWAVLMMLTSHAAITLGMNAGRIVESAYVGIHVLLVTVGVTLALSWPATAFESRGALKRYAIRRVFRIVPMFWAGIAFYVVARGILDFPGRNRWLDVAMTASFVHNWSWSALNSVVHGDWSIGVVATFYLIYPLLTRWVRPAIVFWALLALGVVVTQIGDVYTRAHHINEAFGWSFPGTGVIFLFGMAVARYFPRHPAGAITGGAARAGKIGAVALLVFLIAGLPFCHLPTQLVTYRLQVAAIAAGLCVLLQAYPVWLVVNPALVAVGRWTLSILVLHPFLLVCGQPIADRLARQIGGTESEALILPIFTVLIIGGSLVLGYLGYTLVEQPGIQLGRRLTRASEEM